jgi:acyl carrier protein
MHNDEVRTTLERIFRDVFEDDALEVTDSLSRDDLKSWDSLGHIRLISATEEAFDVTFTIEEIDSLTCVGQLVESVVQKR